MREDQKEQLNGLAERVMDVFLTESDPQNWTGSGKSAAEMTPDIRGARNWDIKNANQAGALVMRVLDLRDRLQGADWNKGQPPDDRAEADIARYEKEAKKLLETMSAKRGK
jgi:hypothetical protein